MRLLHTEVRVLARILIFRTRENLTAAAAELGSNNSISRSRSSNRMSDDDFDGDLTSWPQAGSPSKPVTIADIYRSTIDETAPKPGKPVPPPVERYPRSSLQQQQQPPYSVRTLIWRVTPVIVLCYLWFSASEHKVEPIQLDGAGGEEIVVDSSGAPIQTLGAALEATLDQIDENFGSPIGGAVVDTEAVGTVSNAPAPTIVEEEASNLLNHLLNTWRHLRG
jgi:hypothetical protein